MILRARQYENWKELRFSGKDSLETKKAVHRLGSHIKKILNLRVPQARSTETTSPLALVSLGDAYSALTISQRDLAKCVYLVVKQAVECETFDVFYSQLSKAPSWNRRSKAEIFYRLKDLAVNGLIKVDARDPKSTRLITVPEVRELLVSERVIESLMLAGFSEIEYALSVDQDFNKYWNHLSESRQLEYLAIWNRLTSKGTCDAEYSAAIRLAQRWFIRVQEKEVNWLTQPDDWDRFMLDVSSKQTVFEAASIRLEEFVKTIGSPVYVYGGLKILMSRSGEGCR